MAEDAETNDAPVIEEGAGMDPADEATPQVDNTTDAGDAEDDGATGAADPKPAQKSPSTAQRAKPKVSKAQHLIMILLDEIVTVMCNQSAPSARASHCHAACYNTSVCTVFCT